jgi:hypothetical protein
MSIDATLRLSARARGLYGMAGAASEKVRQAASR